MSASGGYVRIESREEAERVAFDLRECWYDSSMPPQQWAIASRELEEMKAGRPCAPFAAFVDLVRAVPMHRPSILEVGSGCCHYEDVLKIAGIEAYYTGVDDSPSMEAWVQNNRPSTRFFRRDATDLPPAGNKLPRYDIAVEGCSIIHNFFWREALNSLFRATSDWAILHRVPLSSSGKVEYWRKEAYGRPCFEQHFALSDLVEHWWASGFQLEREYVIRETTDTDFGIGSYLLKRRTT